MLFTSASTLARLFLFFVLVRTALGAGSASALSEVDAASGASASLDWTALHSAASAGNVELVQSLLAANAQAVVVDAKWRTSSFLLAVDDNGMSALHFAASKGHTEVLRVLLAADAQLGHWDSKGWDDDGWAALHHAAFNGHAEAVRTLLAANPRPPGNSNFVSDLSFDEAAHWWRVSLDQAAGLAAEKGHAEVLHVLVAAGALMPFDRAALHSAAAAGDVQLVRSLLADYEQVLMNDKRKAFLYAMAVDSGDANGMSALHFAASKGHTEVVSVLLAAGAQLGHWDSKGWAALHHAAFNGHAEAVRTLLAAHPRPPGDSNFVRDVSLDKAADLAAEKGHAEVLHVLVAAGAQVRPDWAALHSAAAAGDVQLVRSLLAAYGHVLMNDGEIRPSFFFYVGAVDANGTSALHFAASKGHTEVVRVLLAAGAQLGHRDNEGWTALHHAAFHGHAEAARVMLAFEKRLGLVDSRSRTALHLAAFKDRAEVVHVLLAAGAQLEAEDDLGMTALHMSAFEGSAEAVRVLLAAGAQLEAVDTYGLTALQYAVANTHVEVAQALLSANAQLPAAGVLGMVALHAALVLGRIDGGALALFSRTFLPRSAVNFNFMGGPSWVDDASGWGMLIATLTMRVHFRHVTRTTSQRIAGWALAIIIGSVLLLFAENRLPRVTTLLVVILLQVAFEAACRVVICLLCWLRWLPDAVVLRPQQLLPVAPHEARPA